MVSSDCIQALQADISVVETGAAVVPKSMPLLDEPTPETELRWKCHTCKSFFYDRYLVMTDDGKKHCPGCGETHLVKMCRLDHADCTHIDPIAKIAYCPECGQPMCPECGCHDVLTISRVTGYLQDVSGWNAGKKQELKDRHRWNPGSS